MGLTQVVAWIKSLFPSAAGWAGHMDVPHLTQPPAVAGPLMRVVPKLFTSCAVQTTNKGAQDESSSSLFLPIPDFLPRTS